MQRPAGGQVRNTASLCVLVGHTGPVRTLAATCGRVFSGSYDRTVCVWDVEGLVRIGTLAGHTEVHLPPLVALTVSTSASYMSSTAKSTRVETPVEILLLLGC
jgi:WD40 repeat protein